MTQTGGRFDFEDGGSYSGGWLEGKAHGHGVCTGPKDQGEYAGAWVRGFEDSGVYTWPSGNTYSGEWQDGKRHGVGVEIKGHWVYRGEWSHGYKGRYGIRQSTLSCAKYEGTWTTNLQDGYGVETYVDEGTYQGQWQKGMRHGFGVRQSAAFAVAAQHGDRETLLRSSTPTTTAFGAHDALRDRPSPSSSSQRGRNPDPGPAATDRHKGGFVLTERTSPGAGASDGEQGRSRSSSTGRSFADRFRLHRGQSTGDLPQSVNQPRSASAVRRNSQGRTGDGSGAEQESKEAADTGVDPEAREVYLGEWKTDKRSGFGVSERSDGLKYVGEWYNDKRHGYGVTTLRDGAKEEGKYKDNELITSGRKRKLFTMSKARLRDRVDAAVVSATRAAEVAQQRALIAVTRKTSAKQKAEMSDKAAMKALIGADLAREEANKYNQQSPNKTSSREAPVFPDNRARTLPAPDVRSNPREVPSDKVLPRSDVPDKPVRLLAPRQESSDSYNSNQSSSLGSSSVTTSPPPPKPLRSPPHGNASSPPLAPNRTPRGGPEVYALPGARPSDPLYSPDLRGGAALDPTNPGGGRGGGGGDTRDFDSGYQSRSQVDRMNSFRNFRSVRDIESSSTNSVHVRDFSDSAESAGPPPAAAPRNNPPSDASPTSPKILLRPATPTRVLPGPRDNAPSAGDRAPMMDTGRPFSPVLSDRRYQVTGSVDDPTGNADLNRVVGAGDEPFSRSNLASLNNRDSETIPPQHLHQQQLQRTSSSSLRTRIPGGTQQQFSTSAFQGQSLADEIDYPLQGHRSGVSSVPPSSGPVAHHQSLRRRETLPSIVRYPDPTLPSAAQGGRSQGEQRLLPQRETYVVENGVHRRLIARSPEPVYDRWRSPSAAAAASAEERVPVARLQRFALEAAEATGGGGGLSKQGVAKSSLPDVRRAREGSSSIPPRERVFALSQQRREELRKQREETERGTLVIRLADVTGWCRENQFILVLIALNLSLAAIFLNFLNNGSGASKN